MNNTLYILPNKSISLDRSQVKLDLLIRLNQNNEKANSKNNDDTKTILSYQPNKLLDALMVSSNDRTVNQK